MAALADPATGKEAPAASSEETARPEEGRGILKPNPGRLESWPLDNFLARQTSCERVKPQCVLLTTGAMNPPHRGHAQLLRQARARLEQEGYDVLAAWVSPSHDGYVGPKAGRLGTVHISSAFRLHLARLMLHGDDFVSVGAWEAQYDGLWPDFPVVAEALQRSLHDLGPALRGPSGKARVFYACGTDHAERCGLYRGLGPDIGVVVVPREGERPDAERPKSLVFVATAAPGELATYSSTKIRKALKEGDHAYVSNAISDAAAQFLLAPTPEDHACFKRDFRALGVRARE